MAGGGMAPGEFYSKKVAYTYIFNLIVGAGALALPIGFHSAGMFLSLAFLALVAFLAFITMTWLNEAQAAANAVLNRRNQSSPSERAIINERERLIQLPSTGDFIIGNQPEITDSIFDITTRTEMGLMAELFLGRIGHKLFYVILVIYLYGDLAIYAVTVPLSLATVVHNTPDHGLQLGSLIIPGDALYYVYVALFSATIVPFSFFSFQKTKYLQIATLATRNIALFMMIILSLIYIAQGNGATISQLQLFNVRGLPLLFGVSVYAFMCHHSLPSMITPVKDKSGLMGMLIGDSITVYVIYGLLCMSAMFAFGTSPHETCDETGDCQIQKLYTLNFQHYFVRPIAVFLSLFPVFTLSSNFPLIAITLRNNLMELIPLGKNSKRFRVLRQVIFTLVTTLPPIGIALGTQNIDELVSFTGSYAGLFIMFVIPGLLVHFSRKVVAADPILADLKNPFRSPFAHVYWIVMMCGWSAVCLCLVTLNHIVSI
eukprot:TRINITY_DN7068_c0_g1_i1.p1 TRINITY_DN7068_c0_g1~~TRINITY_DN7068_c0_g1_i1.p1  ORF type:complete len:486 (+),score=94.24 TRINITY_DN7068_c0_g1_i1:164-1621(+)